jgi:phenylacetaldehyde dehydrogenase
VVCGGKPDASAPGYTFPLTIVTGLTDGARLVDEEQFGPVLPVMKYSADEEVCITLMRLEVGQGHLEQMRRYVSFGSDSSSRTVSIFF